MIKHLSLWEYTVDYDGRDCDGGHASRREFLAVERPEEVVFNKGELFGEGGVSKVRLVDGSDADHGTASVSTPTDEGYSRYDITWSRVTSPKVLGEFLDTYEQDGPRLTTGFYYTDLYKARISHIVAEKFPAAMTVTFAPSTQRGELWRVLRVRGLDDRNCPTNIWEGEGSPFDEETLKQLSHDLEQLHADVTLGTEPVSVHV